MTHRERDGPGSAFGSVVPTLLPGIESIEVILLAMDKGGRGCNCLHLSRGNS